MESSNKLHVDYRDNPELAAILSAKKPGERVSLEVEVTVDRNDDNGLVASLDSISAEVEGENEESMEVSPEISADAPVQVVLKANAKTRERKTGDA